MKFPFWPAEGASMGKMKWHQIEYCYVHYYGFDWYAMFEIELYFVAFLVPLFSFALEALILLVQLEFVFQSRHKYPKFRQVLNSGRLFCQYLMAALWQSAGSKKDKKG